MKNIIFILIFISCLFFNQFLYAGGRRVEVKDGWFYVDGDRFFVKGIVYEGWRPHQAPGEDNVDLKLADNDFSKIKEAGFNTIRTAGGLTPELIDLAKKHGLMVMHGIWFEKDINYIDPEKIRYAINMVEENVKWAKKHDNILCYLIMNEPPMERVEEAGKSGTEEFLKKIYPAAKKLDPGTPVSFTNWAPLDFIDQSFFDAICFNVYCWSPNIISYSLGYRDYVKYLKQKIAKNKPLIITEFGLSISKECINKTGPGNLGYGGNTEQEQKDALLSMYDELIQANAQGGCVHEWIDTWWRPSDKHIHNDAPEEWFGIIDIDTNPKGVPRAAYYALKEYNQAIVVKPKGFSYYRKIVPIEVYTTELVNSIEYKIGTILKGNLTKSSNHWWNTEFDSNVLKDGKHVLEITAKDKNEKALCCKKIPIFIANTIQPEIPYKVQIITDKPNYKSGDMMNIIIKVTDTKNQPVANKEVYCSYFNAVGWQETSFQRTTNAKGEAYCKYQHFGQGFLKVAAGVKYQKEDYQSVYGDIITVETTK